MNDTEATTLSCAFHSPSTRISLIWATGLNAGLILPLSLIPELKLGNRPKDWMDRAKNVIVNAEVSMLGAQVFPVTEVDKELDDALDHPGFQPLEQLTSGRYLGEINRLFMVRGAHSGALFDKIVTPELSMRFKLDAKMSSEFEV